MVRLVLIDNGLHRTRNLRKELAKTYEDRGLREQSDTDLIKGLYEAYQPELDKLATADGLHAPVEASSTAVREPGHAMTPSQLLYNGQRHRMVDTVLLRTLVLKWILTGDYLALTSGQREEVRLPFRRFSHLQRLFSQILKTWRDVYMLIVLVVINASGEEKTLRELSKSKTQWWDTAHEKTELLGDFTTSERKFLASVLDFKERLDIVQLAAGELVPGSLVFETEDVPESQIRPFQIGFCEAVLRVAGALGHVDSQGAKAYTGPVHLRIWNARDCIISVLAATASPKEAFYRMLDWHAIMHVSQGLERLDSGDQWHRAILRLLLMSGSWCKSSAQKMRRALELLPKNSTQEDFFGEPLGDVRERLLDALGEDGLGGHVALVLTGASELLSEAESATKETPPKRQELAVSKILSFFARATNKTALQASQGRKVIARDISFGLDIVGGGGFATDPAVLDEAVFPKDQDLYKYTVDSI